MLADWGLEVVGEAENAASGSAAAARLRPEAALVDVMLPDGDGVALAQELAALPWKPRVVLTSRYADAAGPDEIGRSGRRCVHAEGRAPDAGLDRLLGGG